MTDIVEEILKDHGSEVLEHYGVKGMRWGHRKEFLITTPTNSRGSGITTTRSRSGGGNSHTVLGSEHFSKTQAASMNDVAKKMEKAYGYKIDEFVLIDHTKEKNYLAYVEVKNKGHSAIHVTDNPKLKQDLVKMQKAGWFVPSDSKHVIEANLTHEAAHAMFHTRNLEGKGFIAGVKTKESIAPMRMKAWKKAEEQARKDGDVVSKRFLPDQAQYQMAAKLSKYANASMFIEEHEAELFAAYHWSKNPPKFVDVFMNDIHNNMGVKVQPFSGRKVNHAA